MDALTEVEGSYKVSAELAKQIALGFFNTDSSYIAGRKTNRSPKIREVSRVALSDTLDFEAFVINEAEGFVMIAGDSRVMPILAYASEGELTAKNLEEVNGLKVWYQETMKQIDQELKGIDKVHPIVYNEWKKYAEQYDPKGRIWDNTVANNPNSNCYEWYQYGQFMCSPYSWSYSRAPLFSNRIRWTQSGLSNYFMGIDSGCTSCGKKSAGCGPVAMAQILWYLRPNNSFLWDQMPTLTTEACLPVSAEQWSLASLFQQVVIAADTWVGFYQCESLTYPWKISPGLVQMGLTSGGNVSTFNPNLLMNELYQGYPAIFYGHDNIFNEWHIWASDGFNKNNYQVFDCDTQGCYEWSYTWFFMNWGWSDPSYNESEPYNTSGSMGSINGYYASGNFSPNKKSFNFQNTSLRMITGIR